MFETRKILGKPEIASQVIWPNSFRASCPCAWNNRATFTARSQWSQCWWNPTVKKSPVVQGPKKLSPGRNTLFSHQILLLGKYSNCGLWKKSTEKPGMKAPLHHRRQSGRGGQIPAIFDQIIELNGWSIALLFVFIYTVYIYNYIYIYMYYIYIIICICV